MSAAPGQLSREEIFDILTRFLDKQRPILSGRPVQLKEIAELPVSCWTFHVASQTSWRGTPPDAKAGQPEISGEFAEHSVQNVPGFGSMPQWLEEINFPAMDIGAGSSLEAVLRVVTAGAIGSADFLLKSAGTPVHVWADCDSGVVATESGSRAEAETLARRQAEALCLLIADAKCDTMTSIDTKTEITAGQLVRVPIYAVRYEVMTTTGIALISGIKREVVSATLPGSSYESAAFWTVLLGTFATAGVVGAHVFRQPWLLYASAVMIAAVFALGVFAIRQKKR